jgi:hypothetical protein
VVGFAYLVSRPVATVKEIPKDAPAQAVYYIPGSRSGSNSGLANAKRKVFVSGVSVTVTEDELNALAAVERPSAAPKPKPPAGAKPPATPVPTGPEPDLLTLGTPNFRIRDNEVQVVVPVKISLFGYEQEVLVQTRGPFVRKNAGIAYDPEKLWIGSCPAGRLPGMTGWVTRKVLLAKPLPDDITAAWAKLVDVTILSTSLKLTMP